MISASDIDRLILVARTGYAKNVGSGVSMALTEIGLSTAKGWSGSIPPEFRAKIRQMLIVDHGVPDWRFSGDQDSRGLARSRREAQERSRYEKKAEAVQKDRVLVKALAGRAIGMSGMEFPLPDGCHLSIRMTDADLIQAPGIILVENLEVFQDIHLLDFDVPQQRRGDLVVFRGKPHVARQDTAEAFLKRAGRPVMACVDIDPAGLSNALSTPLFEDILWPGREFLIGLKRLWRPDRYQAQRQVMGRLDGASGELAKARDFLHETGAGVMQEAFLKPAFLSPG